MGADRKSTRKKTTSKKTSRTKAPSRKPSRKTAAPKKAESSRKAPAALKKAPTVESLARKIVRVTTNPANFRLADLYAETCTSLEAGAAEPVVGLEGLEEKNKWWDSIREHENWKPRNVFIKGNTIAIEWDAEIRFRDGRSVEFSEVAVHEIRSGKIIAERFYYDRSVMGLETNEEAPELAAPSAPRTGPEPNVQVGTPPLDPMDV